MAILLLGPGCASVSRNHNGIQSLHRHQKKTFLVKGHHGKTARAPWEDYKGAMGRLVVIIIVTKTRSQEDINQLIKMGYVNFAENRVQEAQKKYLDLLIHSDIKLDLIGPLQSNKVKQALNLFDTIQSVDRVKIVNEIVKCADYSSKTKNFYIQVNIGQEPQKSGIMPDDLETFYQFHQCLE